MHPRITSLLLALAFVLVIAGCGSSSSSSNNLVSQSPTQIINASQSAIKNVTSVHMVGSGQSSGGTVSFDLSLVTGQGGEGEITTNGEAFQIIVVGGYLYLKAPQATWDKTSGNPAVGKLLANKWLKAPESTSSFQSYSSLTNFQQVVQASLSSHSSSLTKTGATTVAGQSVIGIKDNVNGGVLYVAASGPAYPVQITRTGSSTGTITFSNWNSHVSITAPTNFLDFSNILSSS